VQKEVGDKKVIPVYSMKHMGKKGIAPLIL